MPRTEEMYRWIDDYGLLDLVGNDPERYLLVSLEDDGTRWAETYESIKAAMGGAHAEAVGPTAAWPEVLVDLDTGQNWRIRTDLRIATEGPSRHVRPLDEE